MPRPDLVTPQPQSSRDLKSRRLARELRTGVRDGTWPPGSKLPTEAALVAQTGLSLGTVRRAYEALVADGLIVRRQGAGTFVAERVRPEPVVRRVIGVLVPDTTWYFPRVVAGIEDAVHEAGARLVLRCSHYERRLEDPAIAELLAAGAQGLILVPCLGGEADPAGRVEELQNLPVPVVLAERSVPGAGAAAAEWVCTDHEGGGYDAARHLYGLGHRRIGLLVREDGPTAGPVEDGFVRALTEVGLSPAFRHGAVKSGWTESRTDAVVAELAAGGVTAVVCFGDTEAAALLAAARRAGLAVPGDLAVVSYDDETADVAEIPLTAVSPPRYHLGRMAARVLLQRLDQAEASPLHQIRLRPRLVVRASCGA